jgi:hypothetical protein
VRARLRDEALHLADHQRFAINENAVIAPERDGTTAPRRQPAYTGSDSNGPLCTTSLPDAATASQTIDAECRHHPFTRNLSAPLLN